MPDRRDMLRRIAADPDIGVGMPCPRGTRILGSLIVAKLADCVRERGLLEADPPLILMANGIPAAPAYAAEVTRMPHPAAHALAPAGHSSSAKTPTRV